MIKSNSVRKKDPHEGQYITIKLSRKLNTLTENICLYTVVENLSSMFDLSLVLTVLTAHFPECEGLVISGPLTEGNAIQLNGDVRREVYRFLVEVMLIERKRIIHDNSYASSQFAFL